MAATLALLLTKIHKQAIGPSRPSDPLVLGRGRGIVVVAISIVAIVTIVPIVAVVTIVVVIISVRNISVEAVRKVDPATARPIWILHHVIDRLWWGLFIGIVISPLTIGPRLEDENMLVNIEKNVPRLKLILRDPMRDLRESPGHIRGSKSPSHGDIS
jgi:hypothetical protein